MQCAIAYARHGIPVFRVHWIKPGGRCSCPNPQCGSPGKHPRETGWQELATADESVIREWWKETPEANIGALCGPRSNLTVLDVDGDVGRDTLRELEKERGELPETPHVLTGSGDSDHYYFSHEPSIGNAVRFASGLDTRSAGGFVVGVGSCNVRGDYLWAAGYSLAELRPSKMPQWLIELATHRSPAGTENSGHFEVPDAPIHEGEGRNNLLYRLTRSLKARNLSEAAIRAAVEETNRAQCQPSLGQAELSALLANALRQPDRADFAGAGEMKALPAPPPQRKQWPDPLDAAAFHGPAGRFVRIVEPHSEADPAALLVQFLVAGGSIVGRHVFRKAEGARHHTNLFAVIVGDTGHARRGSALARVLQPIRVLAPDWIDERVQTGLSSGEGLINAVRDPAPMETGKDGEVTSDPGIVDKRLMVIEQEFASVLKVFARASNTLSAVFRNAWDGNPLQTMTKNSAAKATNAHISVVGHITIQELVRCLDSTEAANGAANRILWICARRSKLLPRGGMLKDSDFAPLLSELEAVLRFCAIQRELDFSHDAWTAWDRVYPALSAGRPGLLGAVLGRAEAQTLRLAVLYAALDCSPTVELVHLQAALAVWAYAEESAEVIFGDRLGDPDADAILEALRANREGFNRTQINELFNRNLSAARIGRALESLLKGGFATMESKPTGGRPVELWKAK